MAYDEISALSIRAALDSQPDVVEKHMMGMVTGHMLGGVRTHKDGVNRFMFRVGKEREVNALAKPGAERVTMGARKMPGFIYVATTGSMTLPCKVGWHWRWTTLRDCHPKSKGEDVTAFSGFSKTALTFLTDLKANNNRDWFAAHKAAYDGEIKAPALALGAQLGDALGQMTGTSIRQNSSEFTGTCGF